MSRIHFEFTAASAFNFRILLQKSTDKVKYSTMETK